MNPSMKSAELSESEVNLGNQATKRKLSESEEKAGNQATKRKLSESEEKPGNQATKRKLSESEEKPGNQATKRKLSESEEKTGNPATKRKLSESEEKAGNQATKRKLSESEEKAGNQATKRKLSESEEKAGNQATKRKLSESEANPGNQATRTEVSESEINPCNQASRTEVSESEVNPGNQVIGVDSRESRVQNISHQETMALQANMVKIKDAGIVSMGGTVIINPNDSIGQLEETIDSKTDHLQKAMSEESQTIQQAISEEGQTIQQTIEMQSKRLQESITGSVQEAVVKTKEDIVAVDDTVGKLLETASKTSVEQQKCINDLGQKVEHQRKEIKRLTDQIKEDNPGRRAMIETTKVTIDRCTHQNQFVPTKAFEDAKTKLCQQKIIIIKGNSGDGKTRTAHELVAWMSKGERYRKQPIQLDNLENCDKIVEPNLNLCIFIDDVSTDLFKEIEKRHEFIKSLIYGEMNGKSNCLVITLRNDVFKSMSSSNIFVEENVVDTSSKEYHIKEEKEQILDIYLPKEVKFSETERSEIVESAPDIGFPQCCRLYRDVPELQNQGVKFFCKPFHFMKIALSKLEYGRCAALLYLFLCGGEVLEKDLGPSNDKIDKTLLEEVFDVDLVDVKSIGQLSHKKKVQFIHKSLDCLSGSLVTKQKWWRGHYYRFTHDSVKDTVALLYGEVDLIGFIQNCHCNSLCYITTSKNTPNKIFIDPDNYNHMYSHLLRELKCKQSENYQCIASLDVWNDNQFVSGFFRWLDKLDGEGIDKDFYLKWTTEDEYGPYHFYSYRGYRYYSESDDSHSSDRGDRYRGHTYFPSFLVYVAETNNLCLLNQLLKRTPKDHPQLQWLLFGVVRAGHIDVFNMIIERGINPTLRAVVSQSSHLVFDINVLHEACLFERVEMVTKLATKYPSLVQDTCDIDGTVPTLHVVVKTGNCSLYDTVETIILGDISREDRVKRLSRMVDVRAMTVLYYSCSYGYSSNTMVLHLLHKYPELVSIRDMFGRHCLHYIASSSNKDLFIQVNTYLQKYYKDKGVDYDITTIVDMFRKSVLDWAKEGRRDKESVEDMCSYLSQFWS